MNHLFAGEPPEVKRSPLSVSRLRSCALNILSVWESLASTCHPGVRRDAGPPRLSAQACSVEGRKNWAGVLLVGPSSLARACLLRSGLASDAISASAGGSKARSVSHTVRPPNFVTPCAKRTSGLRTRQVRSVFMNRVRDRAAIATHSHRDGSRPSPGSRGSGPAMCLAQVLSRLSMVGAHQLSTTPVFGNTPRGKNRLKRLCRVATAMATFSARDVRHSSPQKRAPVWPAVAPFGVGRVGLV